MSSADEFDTLVLEEEGPPSRKRKSTASVEPTELPQKLDLGMSDASQGLAMVAIVDIAALDPHWAQRLKSHDENPRWELLSEPAEVDGVIYSHRQPEFLSRLTDRPYIDPFHHLKGLSIRQLRFSSWSKVMKEYAQHTGAVVFAMLKHVISWVNPQFKLPGCKSPDAVAFTWDDIIQKQVISQQKQALIRRPMDAELQADTAASARDFVDTVWKYVRIYHREINLDENKPYLSEMIPMPAPTDHTNAKAYCGTVFSTETFMNHWNDENTMMAVKLPWNVWGSITETSHYTHNPELRQFEMLKTKIPNWI
ncbi:hypothetical protein VTN77DRAFT_88 [Rasamsonia byssochlamydoides]|uniref:uncharacterized protein n=1 Tax=Rasamsonia byssochlamydoides TaxID=89139 RepID=UPI0037429CEB